MTQVVRSIGHRASGIGHRASGIGRRASGVGWIYSRSIAVSLMALASHAQAQNAAVRRNTRVNLMTRFRRVISLLTSGFLVAVVSACSAPVDKRVAWDIAPLVEAGRALELADAAFARRAELGSNSQDALIRAVNLTDAAGKVQAYHVWAFSGRAEDRERLQNAVAQLREAYSKFKLDFPQLSGPPRTLASETSSRAE